MHASLARLLDFACRKTANDREPVTTTKELLMRMGVQSAVMTNWKARGVSKEGAIKAGALFGCSVNWVLDGEGAESSEAPSQAKAAARRDHATDVAAAIAVIGDAIESMADQESRRIATDTLRTFISSPGACGDLVQPIARRLAGEISEPAQRRVNEI